MSGLPPACDLSNPNSSYAACQLAGGGSGSYYYNDPCNLMNPNTSTWLCKQAKEDAITSNTGPCNISSMFVNKDNCIAAGGTPNGDPCNILNPNATLQTCGQQTAANAVSFLKIGGIVVIAVVVLFVVFVVLFFVSAGIGSQF